MGVTRRNVLLVDHLIDGLRQRGLPPVQILHQAQHETGLGSDQGWGWLDHSTGSGPRQPLEVRQVETWSTGPREGNAEALGRRGLEVVDGPEVHVEPSRTRSHQEGRRR